MRKMLRTLMLGGMFEGVEWKGLERYRVQQFAGSWTYMVPLHNLLALSWAADGAGM